MQHAEVSVGKISNNRIFIYIRIKIVTMSSSEVTKAYTWHVSGFLRVRFLVPASECCYWGLRSHCNALLWEYVNYEQQYRWNDPETL